MYTLSKEGVFIGKYYLDEGKFKLNIINNMNNVIYAYIIDSFSLWHNHLGHVSYQWMDEMAKLDLILHIDNNVDRCRARMITKITKNPFPKVKNCTNFLELMHSDACDMLSNSTIGGKKYFVTFINDFFLILLCLLLHSKYEML